MRIRRRLDSLTPHFREAFEQFLRYMVARPLQSKGRVGKPMEPNQLKNFRPLWIESMAGSGRPIPVKQRAEAEKLARSDSRLARLLFSPTVYPGVERAPGKFIAPNRRRRRLNPIDD